MAVDEGQEETEEKKTLEERTRETSSPSTFIKAGAFSSVDLEKAPEELPAFVMRKNWGDGLEATGT